MSDLLSLASMPFDRPLFQPYPSHDVLHHCNGMKCSFVSSRKRLRDEKSTVTSPYFQKQRNRKPNSPYSESEYFCRSPSSAYGAVQLLGSLLHCLSGGRQPCNSGTGCHYGCCTCQKVIDAAVRHFACCSTFQNAWASYQHDSTEHAFQQSSSTETMCFLSEKRLERCVRHLCPFRCYERAYAPYRDWWSLIKDLIEKQVGTSINELVSGWKCILLHAADLSASSSKEGDIAISRTAFVSPDNRVFTNRVKVLKELEYSSKRSSDCEEAFSSKCLMKQKATFRPFSLLCKRSRELSKGEKTSNIRVDDNDVVASPYGLLEELFSNDPWKLLLSTIFLNRTSRAQVDPILHNFLDIWPTASAVATADLRQLSSLLKPLGLHRRRAVGIMQFSRDYLSLLSHGSPSCADDASTFTLPEGRSKNELTRFTSANILRLYNCGEYACDAFKIFIQTHNDFEPTDAVLKVYVDYQRARMLDL